LPIRHIAERAVYQFYDVPCTAHPVLAGSGGAAVDPEVWIRGRGVCDVEAQVAVRRRPVVETKSDIRGPEEIWSLVLIDVLRRILGSRCKRFQHAIRHACR